MTAPAEDPRSGETPVVCLCDGLTGPHSYGDPRCLDTPPAAGRGDTDSGGDDLDRYIAEQQWDPAFRTAFAAAQARPAGDRAQPTQARPTCACGGPCDHDGSLAREQLFHTVYDLIVDHPMWIDGDGNGLDYSPEREARIGDFLDELLALPAVVALLDAQAAVTRVRELAADFDDGEGWGEMAHPGRLVRASILAALNGTTT